MSKPLRKCLHCGLEAFNIEDLENFTKGKRGKHGRKNSCHRCTREHKRLPKPNYLRKCRVCGLEAHTLEEVGLFTYHKTGKFNKANLCKDCRRKSLRKPKVIKPYLRKCLDCGVEAKTEDELETFAKNRAAHYGKANLCKTCVNKREVIYRAKNPDRNPFRKRQLRLIEGFPKPVTCYFCGNPVIKLKGCESDSLIIHSLDRNHENWDPPNKVPSHRSCHNTHHNLNSSPEVLVKRILGHVGEKHPKWKGEQASDQAKYYRKLRAERREEKIKKLLEKV